MDGNVIYANALGIAISQVDCCISFNTQIPKNIRTKDGAMAVDTVDFVNVILSMEYAKKLSNMLADQIKQHETLFGPIKELEEHSSLPQKEKSLKGSNAK
jgi:hypothetical protein